jgi:DNA-binding protein H-NS
MQEIAKFTFTYEHFPEVMSMLWKRMLESSNKNWRRTYKSLLLLSYLLRNGSERVVTSARDHLYDMKPLEEFAFKDDHGKDQGINVRQKAKEVISFLQDDEKIREERRKAKKTRDKYVGVSSNEFRSYSEYADEPRINKDYGSEEEADSGLTRERRKQSFGWLSRGRRYHDQYDEKDYQRNRKPYKDDASPPQERKQDILRKEEEVRPMQSSVAPGPPKLLEVSGQAPNQSSAARPAVEPSDPFGDFTTSRVQAQAPLAGIDFASASASAAAPAPAPAPLSVGGDFAAFQSATPQQADFANFQAAPAMLPPAPVQQAQPTEVSTSSLGGFSGFQGVAAPQPAVSPMPSSQPVPTAAVSSLQPGPLSAAQIMQQQPAVMQPQTLLQTQLSEAQPTTKAEMPAKQEPNKSTTWSGAGVDISLDSLNVKSPKEKSSSTQPSMNQLAQQNVVQPAPGLTGMGAYSGMGMGMGMQQQMPRANMTMGMGAMGMGAMGMPMGYARMPMGGSPYGNQMGMAPGMTGGMGMMGYQQVRPGMQPGYSGFGAFK